jgi:hypothetical protein
MGVQGGGERGVRDGRGEPGARVRAHRGGVRARHATC